MQMVLYNVPSSLTVPEEQDSVRRAILETRARARQRQRARDEERRVGGYVGDGEKGLGARDWYQGMMNGTTGVNNSVNFGAFNNRAPNANGLVAEQAMQDDDPDAMDLG